MSQNERISIPPPKVTANGKYGCTVDNTVFGNVDDYDMHCRAEHMKAGGGKTW